MLFACGCNYQIIITDVKPNDYSPTTYFFYPQSAAATKYLENRRQSASTVQYNFRCIKCDYQKDQVLKFRGKQAFLHAINANK